MIVFKPRGRVIQLVRSGDGGKGEATALGTIKAPAYALDAALAERLTAQEQQQVAAQAERLRTAERVAREHAAHTLAETVRLATEWLKTADRAEAAAFAEDVRSSFGRLRKHLAKLSDDETEDA